MSSPDITTPGAEICSTPSSATKHHATYRAIARVMPILVFSGVLAGGQDNRLEKDYASLEAVALRIQSRGATQADMNELRGLKDSFASGKDVAAEFLIKKLDSFNSKEAEILAGSDDPMKRTLVYDYLRKHQRSYLVKYDLCMILADMYGLLAPPTQRQVRRSITASYMPGSYGREDLGGLNWALLRIGSDAIPSLLELANHKSPNVRCSVSDVLKSLAGDQKDPAVAPPPELDCHADEEQREAAIHAWGEWWKGLKHPVFERPPDFFDSSLEKGYTE